jgi:hypothetical protein
MSYYHYVTKGSSTIEIITTGPIGLAADPNVTNELLSISMTGGAAPSDAVFMDAVDGMQAQLVSQQMVLHTMATASNGGYQYFGANPAGANSFIDGMNNAPPGAWRMMVWRGPGLGTSDRERFAFDNTSAMGFDGSPSEEHLWQNSSNTLFNRTLRDLTGPVVAGFGSGGGSSDICFLEGTPVVTDQGEMAIESITAQNTINGKEVVGITKTQNEDYMILFKKDALGENVPSQDTYVTKDHGIFLGGMMIRARKLVDSVNVISWNVGRCNIYNVLLKTHEKMVVNNMEVESLDPDHPKAKYYLMRAEAQEQDQIVKQA